MALKQINLEKTAGQTSTSGIGQLQSAPVQKPIIVSARTGLASEEDSLMLRLPSSYRTGSVRDVLGYLVDVKPEAGQEEMVASLKRELGAAGSVIVINGKNAKLTDKASEYLVDQEKDGRQYQELQIEVSGVQQGGRFYRF